MKFPLIFLTVVLGALSPIFAQTEEELKNQEPLEPGMDDRFDDLSDAFATMLQFEEVTKEIAKQHPELAEEVAKVQKEMTDSVVGKGFQGVVAEMKRRLGKEYFDFERGSREQIRKWGAADKVDLETARLGLGNAAAMSKGKLELEILRTVLTMNPEYRDDPLKQMKDGWAGGYSSKMDEEKREVNFLLMYPGTWKPVERTKRAELITLWSDGGHGNHRLTLQVIHAPDPKYAAMEGVELAKLLVPPKAKVIESGKSKIAGLAGGKVVYELGATVGEEEKLFRLISYSVHAKDHFISVNLYLGDEEKMTKDELVKKYDPMLAEMAGKLEIE